MESKFLAPWVFSFLCYYNKGIFMDLSLIERLSRIEPKTLMERMVKLQEETGELAQEILVEHKTSGSKHKTAGSDGILGESVDVVLVSLSIFFAHGGTVDKLEELILKKCLKWQKHQG